MFELLINRPEAQKFISRVFAGKTKFIFNLIKKPGSFSFQCGKRSDRKENASSSEERQVKVRDSSIALFLVFVCFLAQPMSAGESADAIFWNGNIYTADDRHPHVEAVAVSKDRICAVGTNADMKRLQRATTRMIDLGGRTVVPGLTDAHCHIFGIGERELAWDLEKTNSLEDLVAKLKVRASQIGKGKWIVGRGWIETFWKPPRFPNRIDLDRVTPDQPVFLTRADGHASVANSAALKIAGIDHDTPDPFGGEILKDKVTGEPTGMLLDNAQSLVEQKIPPPTETEREEALARGVEREIALGWCQIQNAGSHKDDIELIRKFYAAGKIKLRIYNAVYGPGADAEHLLAEGPAIDDFDHHFTQRTIKVIFDGALGSRGAALLKPYSDAPDTSGYLTEKPEELRPMFSQALRRGIQVETHAIGDRANRTILDLYEQAFTKGGAISREPAAAEVREPLSPEKIGQAARWRVEHAQIVDPADIPRFAKFGIIASMQPSHAISDLFFAPARLGMDRLTGAYAWQSFLKSGAIICGGSDAPVERGEPMIEFYAAVARKSVDGFSGEGWHPEQAVAREDALKMFSLWPAVAAFQEKDKGSIEPGKLADFTVLSNDIMKVPEAEILKTRNEMTVIGGQVVFDRSNERKQR